MHKVDNHDRWTMGKEEAFSFANTLSYKMYRVNILSPVLDSHSYISVFELQMYNDYNDILLLHKNDCYFSVVTTSDTETVIPKMTSNTSPSGRAFAKDIYSTSYDAWKAFNQVDDTEGYASKTGSGGVGFLGYEFDKPIAIAKYAVRSMAGSSHLNKLPRDWTFEGSHDGEKWHVLDTQKNQTWTTVNTDKDYYVDIPKSYKMYRLNWSANNGFTGYTDVNELKMYRGVNVVSHIPTVSEKYFTAYGMDKIAQETLKTNYDKVQLISNKESELNEGKIFEHNIDLKKYDVKGIGTLF
ncbi:hypothetical protein ABD76_20115 [Paenibacillus dendritiformis]|nr:hypothetical protein [Paenibacillus dendritiformis]